MILYIKNKGYVNMDKTLADLTVIELKALAYDQMAQLELVQNNLRFINQELNRRVSSNHPASSNLGPTQHQRPVIEPLPPGSIQPV